MAQRDLETSKTALSGVQVEESFVPAIAPRMVGRGQNQYCATDEASVFAIAKVLQTEYKAIVDAGFILECLWLQEWTSPLALIRALEGWIADDHEQYLPSALGYQTPSRFERDDHFSHETPFAAA